LAVGVGNNGESAKHYTKNAASQAINAVNHSARPASQSSYDKQRQIPQANFYLAVAWNMDGALTQLDLAVSDTRKFVNGAYYHPIGKLIGNATHPQGSNATLQRQLWEETSRMIEEAGFGFANSTYMRNYLDN